MVGAVEPVIECGASERRPGPACWGGLRCSVPLSHLEPVAHRFTTPPFTETLHAIQHAEPQRFATLVGGLDANVQAAVQGMMQHAAQLKAEKEAAAAAAANGHPA